jgi:hypothetical protein
MFAQARPGIGSAERSSVDCRSCQSANLKMFSAEIGIHFLGLKNLDKPVVWVFPSLVICLDCGFSEFVVPEEQRANLSNLLNSESARGLSRTG